MFRQTQVHLKTTTNSHLHQTFLLGYPAPRSPLVEQRSSPWPLTRVPDHDGSGVHSLGWIILHVQSATLSVNSGPNSPALLTASHAAVFRLQVLNTPGVWAQIFPQDEWKSSAPLERAINTTRTPSAAAAAATELQKEMFYYRMLSLSGIAFSLRFQVITVLSTLEWHKCALWGKN